MKIAHVLFHSLQNTGGYEIFTYNLLRPLCDMGHDVTLYLPGRELRKRGEFYAKMPFKVRPLLFQTNFLRKKAPWILQQYLVMEQIRHRYDIWKAIGAYPEGYLLCKLKGIVPLIMSAHGDDFQFAPDLNYGMRRDKKLDHFIRETFQTMDRVIALTPGLVKDIEQLGVERERIAIIPNSINFNHFTAPRDLEAVRTKWRIPTGKHFLLTVGRNHPKKGFDLIPEIAARLREMGLNFVWLIVGRENESLLPEIKKRGLQDFVRPEAPIGVTGSAWEDGQLTLPVENLVALYAASDLHVFPSRLETFGRVLIESMAAGTPVVSTDCDGCRDVAGHGKYASMVKVNDVQAMAEAVNHLLKSPEEMAMFQKLGLQRAAEYDWTTVARQYLELYRTLGASG